MSRRVYLHVGEPKCGTTYLQNILWRNRATLAAQGVVLPGRHQWDHFRATQDLRGARQAEGDPAGSWRGEWDRLAAQTRDLGGTAVISHEMLCGAGAEQAGRAIASLGAAEVHVVLTVRDFATLLPAEWQETVKHRNVNSFLPWLAGLIDRPTPERGRGRWFWTAHDTMAILRRWGATLPPGNVHVITMPRRGADPALLWRRFASVLGIPADSVDTSVARPNESLGVAEVEMLRKLNWALRDHDVPDWFYTSRVKDQLAHRALAGRRDATGRLALPPKRRQWAVDRAEEVIAALAESGYDVVGDLDELRPARPRGPRLRPRDVTDEQLFDAALASLTRLLVDEYHRAEDGTFEIRRAAGDPRRVARWQRVYATVRGVGEKVPGLRGARVRVGRRLDETRARRASAAGDAR